MRYAMMAALLVLIAGCASKDKTLEPVAISSPLEFDPTEEYDLPTWWSNGKELLHLGERGDYRLYADNNRYHRPAERGRWTQLSYAALWLEPYAQGTLEAARATISRENGVLGLKYRRLARMIERELPPSVLEDRLIGGWQGDGGVLRLGADLRYSLSLPPPRGARPATLGSQQGAWLLDGDTLLLAPDSAALPPSSVRVRDQDDTITLEISGTKMVRSGSAVGAG